MTSRPGLTAPRSPQWGTTAGRGSEVRPHRNSGGATPKRASEYGLLPLAEPEDPAEPAGDPAAAEFQEFGDGHKATMRTGGLDKMET